MPVTPTDDGRNVTDTATMRAITGRSPAAIRTICTRGPDGYDVAQCSEQLEQRPDEPATVTAAQAEQLPGIAIPANRIYQWAHVGLIRPVDSTGRSPLYAVEELLRLRNKLDRKAQLDL